MKKNEMAQEAYNQVLEEQRKEDLKELKGYFTETLKALEIAKKNKEKIEEEIRVLNKDLDDLKNGKLDQIKERQEKSSLAKEKSKVETINLGKLVQFIDYNNNWYQGTYPITYTATCEVRGTSNSFSKTFYY